MGAYTASDSPYGTFDQGGNVWEFNEALISGSFRGIRGGSFVNNGSGGLLASFRNNGLDPTDEIVHVGFRVATVPEPSTLLLGALGVIGLLLWRRVRR